ncbi:hypothetical protein CPT_Shady_023 [Streptomyces phage Shady]|uniref:Uncharacterized protein n=1 Tax=Streptomyces phage Shady TaxID=2767585 RepID=A0A873WVS1_9CAUD|nr:hypothetical protein CPT_Shady_023 [Streptomyces phage Shady]
MSIKFATVGNGGTVHGTEDETKTLCGKDVSKLVTIPGAEIACKACTAQAKKIESQTPNTEGDDVATESKTAEKTNDEIAAEVKEFIENLTGTVIPALNKSDGEKLDAIMAQTESELLRVSTNKRAVWRTLVKNAISEARERTGNTVAVREAVETVEQIKDYEEVITHTAGVVAESIKSEVDAQEAAKKVASAILDGRLRVTDKQGRPDLKGTRDASKKLAGRIYDAAAEKLIAEEYGSDVADVDELLKGLKNKVSYQMSAVLPEFIRALDNSPEEFAELFPNMEVPEGKNPSDVVFDTYNISRRSKAEMMADNRRAKRELANKVAAGELTEADAEAEAEKLDSEGTSTRAEKSQFEKDTAKLDKLPKELAEIIGRKDERTEEESKKIAEKINATITALTEALTKL